MTAYKRQLPFLAVLETTESLNLMLHSALKKVLFGDYMALSIVFLCVALFVASLSSSFPFPVSPPFKPALRHMATLPEPGPPGDVSLFNPQLLFFFPFHCHINSYHRSPPTSAPLDLGCQT